MSQSCTYLANRLLGLVTGVRLRDYGCTLKAYRADLLREVRLYGAMHRYIPAYLARIGAAVAERYAVEPAEPRSLSAGHVCPDAPERSVR